MNKARSNLITEKRVFSSFAKMSQSYLFSMLAYEALIEVSYRCKHLAMRSQFALLPDRDYPAKSCPPRASIFSLFVIS